MEHRWGQRVTTGITALVSEVSGSSHLARVTDLSVSGAFLRISLPVDALNSIAIELLSPNQKRSGLAIEAYVARRTENGVGIEWKELGPPLVRQLLIALQREAAPATESPLPLAQSG